MSMLKKIFGMLLLSMSLSLPALAADEAPDVLVKRISQEVIETVKTNKDIQSGDQKQINSLIESKILPYVDFQRMTALAAGRFWRDATPEQQKRLTTEFRTLLIYTYSGALSQLKDQKLEFKPLRADPSDTQVEVRSQVIQPRGEPIQLNYRLEKNGNAWKIFDINILGAWMVATYKGNFTTEYNKHGIDGLIKTLSEKNKKLAESKAK